MKIAWMISKIKFGNTVKITFTKTDGSIREAIATQISIDKIEKGYCKFLEKIGNNLYQYRTFKIETVIV